MIPHDQAPEHEFEAELGLPEPLPRGERMLWQGSPDWRLLAREALHTRLLSIYFTALLAWRALTVWSNGGSLADAGVATLWLLPVAALAIAVLSLLAWLMARTSVYTITDKQKLSPAWNARVGYISPQLIQAEVPDYQNCVFYISGPPAAGISTRSTAPPWLSFLAITASVLICRDARIHLPSGEYRAPL